MCATKKNADSDVDSDDHFCSDSSASDSDSDHSDCEDNSEDDDHEEHTDDDADNEEPDEKLHKHVEDDEDDDNDDDDDEDEMPPELDRRSRFLADWFKTNPETDLKSPMLFPCGPKTLNPNDCAKCQEWCIEASVLRPKVGGPHLLSLGRNFHEAGECRKWQELQPLLQQLKESGHEHRMMRETCCGTEDEQTAMSDPKRQKAWNRSLDKGKPLIAYNRHVDRDKTTLHSIIITLCSESTKKVLCFRAGGKVMRILIAHGDVCMFDREVGAQSHWVEGGNETVTVCVTFNPDRDADFMGTDEQRLKNLVFQLEKKVQ